MELELVKGIAHNGTATRELWGKFSGDWKARVVFDVLDDKHFSRDLRQLSSVTGMSLDELYKTLDLLIALGLVKKQFDGSFQKIVKSVDLVKAGFNDQEELWSFVSMANEIISKLTPKGDCKYELVTVYTNINILKKFFKKHAALLDEFKKECDEAQEKNVAVGLQYAFVDMLSQMNRSEK